MSRGRKRENLCAPREDREKGRRRRKRNTERETETERHRYGDGGGHAAPPTNSGSHQIRFDCASYGHRSRQERRTYRKQRVPFSARVNSPSFDFLCLPRLVSTLVSSLPPPCPSLCGHPLLTSVTLRVLQPPMLHVHATYSSRYFGGLNVTLCTKSRHTVRYRCLLEAASS